MSLKIRLARGGSKKRPFYHIVVADVRSPRDGRYIERLGFYNPMVAKDAADRIRTNDERIKYWLSVGAKPTDRVHRFLAQAGLMDKPTINEQTKKDKPKAKALERIREREEAAAAAIEAEEAAKAQAAEEAAAAKAAEEEAANAPAVEDAPAVEETVVEEVPAEETPAEEAS